MKNVFFAAAILCSLSAFAAGNDKWAREAEKIPHLSMEKYVARYPLYLEAAALTKDDQLVPGAPGCPATSIAEVKTLPLDVQKKCLQTGGFGGHGVTFIRGACIKEGTPVPQIYNCSDKPDVMADPYQGVGISTNQDFWNVGWVAIPGYKLFYEGNVEPEEKLTLSRYEDVIQNIKNLHLYDNIEINPDYYNNPRRPQNMNAADFLLLDAIGTDFGSTFRSNIYFVRAPLTAIQLDGVIAYLNMINQEFYKNQPKDKLDWDVFLDNCAHTVNNSFAAAGMTHEKQAVNLGDRNEFPNPGFFTRSFEILKTVFTGNIAVPTNTVIDIARKNAKAEIRSLAQAFRNKKLRAKIKAGLPMEGPGVLVGANLMHENNDMFEYGGPAIVVSMPDFIPSPIFNDNRRRDKLYTTDHFYDLEMNRQYFISAIQRLLRNGERDASVEGEDQDYDAKLKTFYTNEYRPYLEAELARLQMGE